MKTQSQDRQLAIDGRHFTAREKPMRLDFAWFVAALALIAAVVVIGLGSRTLKAGLVGGW